MLLKDIKGADFIHHRHMYMLVILLITDSYSQGYCATPSNQPKSRAIHITSGTKVREHDLCTNRNGDTSMDIRHQTVPMLIH